MREAYRLIFAVVCVSMFSTSLAAQDSPVPPADSGQILLVLGAEGTAEYGEQFELWAERWDEVAEKSGVPITVIGRDAEGEPDDRQRLRDAIAAIEDGGAAPVWIVMIGHGTFARSVAKFNLRGPDVSATELASWLERVDRPVVIVNCASASGPFVNRLSGDKRIVVTSTKSGTQQNYSRFGEYFARAIASPDSDLDHDDEVSVHEAFLRASADVRDFYESEARIATEHALIDDNGDGKGTPATMFRGTRAIAKAKDGAALDGPIASRVTLSPSGSRLPLTDKELEQRAAIETELEQIRLRKGDLDDKAYDALLEPLMLRLARIYQSAEKRSGDHDDTSPAPIKPADAKTGDVKTGDIKSEAGGDDVNRGDGEREGTEPGRETKPDAER